MGLSYVAYRIVIPEEITIPQLSPADLPANWRVEPPPEMIKRLGSAWIAQSEAAFLRLPSVLMPAETNLLANPTHPDYKRMEIGDPTPFSFNPRTWKG